MSSRAHVKLNSLSYVLAPLDKAGTLIRRYGVPIFPQTVTTEVERTSQTFQPAKVYVQDAFTGGIGCATRGFAVPYKRNMVWWSTCDTRWPRYAELALLNQSETHTTDADHIKKYLLFKGDLWGLFEDDYSAAQSTEVNSRKYGATSDDWTGGGIIYNQEADNALGARLWDGTVHKGKMYALTGGIQAAELRHGIYSSSDGATWGSAMGTGWDATDYLNTTIMRRNNFDDRNGKLLDYGATLLAAYYNAKVGESEVRIDKTTNAAANWSVVVQIASAAGPLALESWFDRAGTQRPVLVTEEALWAIDLATPTYTEMLRFEAKAVCATVAADGKLYIALVTGDILQLSLGSAMAGGQYELVIRNIGPATVAQFQGSDGLPTAYRGHANFILGSDPRHLYVAYGGHVASTNATILCFDYDTGAWHHFYNDGTANRDLYLLTLSSEDDDAMRLHAATEHADASVMFMFEDPLRPHWISAAITQTSGILQRPHQHFDADGLGKAVLRVRVRADDLVGTDTSGEYMDYKYGSDGAVQSTTDLGDFNATATTGKQLTFGSGVGISVDDIGDELTLHRDATVTTHSPKLGSVSLFYNIVRPELEGWEFIIDIEASAALQENKSRETLITNLETARNSVPLIAFQDMRLATARNVRIQQPMEWMESYGADAQPVVKPTRISFVRVRIQEEIPA